MNDNLFTLLKSIQNSFNELTEFEDDEPQPRNDPMFGFWLNDVKNDKGFTIDTNDKEVVEFIEILLEKRQTKDGIEELRKIIENKLIDLES